MSTAHRWQDVKAEAHRRHPALGDPERQAKARAELDVYVADHRLTELHDSTGETQADAAQILGGNSLSG